MQTRMMIFGEGLKPWLCAQEENITNDHVQLCHQSHLKKLRET